MTVYSDRAADEFPTGVNICHPHSLVPELVIPAANAGKKAAVVYSDIFRLLMIDRIDAIWVDMDAYCVAPFDFDGPNVFGKSNTSIVLNTIIGLEQGSPVPRYLVDQMVQPNPEPEWLSDNVKAKIAKFQRKGKTQWSMVDLPWGISGPRALTFALRKYDLIDHALPQSTFYTAMEVMSWREMFQRSEARAELLQPDTKAVHFFGQTRKVLAKYPGHNPYVNGFIADICTQHDVHPKDAPIIGADID